MTARLIFCISFMVLSNTTWANSFDINFHNQGLRATYATYTAKKTVTDIGILSLKRNNQRDDEIAIHTGLNMVFDNFRFGGRVIYATPGNNDVLALGFGGQARFSLTSRVGTAGHIYIAPEVTSALDSQGYSEVSLRLHYRLSRGAYAYLGYRNLKVKVHSVNYNIELDDKLHLGLKLFF